MGLFINYQDHPNVYKSKHRPDPANQQVARVNSLTDFIREQQQANAALLESLTDLNSRHEQMETAQARQWHRLANQMTSLETSSRQREAFEQEINRQLGMLDEKNMSLHTLLQDESLLIQSVIDKINSLSESNQAIAKRLEESEAANRQLSQQLNEQIQLQQEVSEQLAHQEEFQTGVLERLDHQEALTEKISRQLNHIRSIVFERANYLATKLEDGYKVTSAYVYKLMTGTDQPLTFSDISEEQKEEQKRPN